jgi:hypothetical protein
MHITYTLLTILQHLVALGSIIIGINIYRKQKPTQTVIALIIYSIISIIVDHISLYFPIKVVGEASLIVFTVFELTLSFRYYYIDLINSN